MLLKDRDRSLDVVKRGLALDLHCKVGAIRQPVDHGVDAAIQHRQEDVEAPTRLCDEARPDEKLGRLSNGNLAAMRPVGTEDGHRPLDHNPSSRSPLPSSTFCST